MLDLSIINSYERQSKQSTPEFDVLNIIMAKTIPTDNFVTQVNDGVLLNSNISFAKVEPIFELKPNQYDVELNVNRLVGGVIEDSSYEMDRIIINHKLDGNFYSVSTLKLYSLENCWVEVSDSDNGILSYNTIQANDEIGLGGYAPPTVISGSAAHVMVKFNDVLFDTVPYTKGGVAKFILRSVS